jgi:hypothetical protein
VNFERFAENLLDLDNRIVYVGIVDGHFKLMHSSFRQGTELDADVIQLDSDPEIINDFMALSSRLTMHELGNGKQALGSISSVLVRFERRVLVFSRLNEYVIIVGLDVEIPTPVPEMIAGLIKTAASESPDLPAPLQTAQVVARSEDT